MKEYWFSDLSLGHAESFSVCVTSDMIDQFAKLSGDLNPLHESDEVAQKAGFDSRLVHGMLSASFYSRLIGMYLPGRYCLLQGMDISFKLPVYANDTLEVLGEIVYMNDAFEQIEIKASIKNSSGKKVSQAKIKVGFQNAR